MALLLTQYNLPFIHNTFRDAQTDRQTIANGKTFKLTAKWSAQQVETVKVDQPLTGVSSDAKHQFLQKGKFDQS